MRPGHIKANEDNLEKFSTDTVNSQGKTSPSSRSERHVLLPDLGDISISSINALTFDVIPHKAILLEMFYRSVDFLQCQYVTANLAGSITQSTLARWWEPYREYYYLPRCLEPCLACFYLASWLESQQVSYAADWDWGSPRCLRLCFFYSLLLWCYVSIQFLSTLSRLLPFLSQTFLSIGNGQYVWST